QVQVGGSPLYKVKRNRGEGGLGQVFVGSPLYKVRHDTVSPEIFETESKCTQARDSNVNHPCWERPETMKEKRPIKIVQTLQGLRLLWRLLQPWLQKYAKQLFNFADTYIVLEAHKSYNSTWYGNKPLWAASKSQKLKISIILSGGQAPGGHTVIYGPFGKCLKDIFERDKESTFYGFKDGPVGIRKCK
ncbi:unnamed protein product, partial [Brassica rapa subsp. narinosa]